MKLEPGDCIISHPKWNPSDTVSFITEINHNTSVALTLNRPSDYTLGELVFEKGYELDAHVPVYHGGTINSGALVMLHDSHWYSSNTMPVNPTWSISSDYFMIDKLTMGNTPQSFRTMLGVSAWEAGELEEQCVGAQPRWLVLKQPTREFVLADSDHQHTMALSLYSAAHTNKWFS